MENTLKIIRDLLIYSNHGLIGYNVATDIPKYTQNLPSHENPDLFIKNNSAVIEIQDNQTASSNENSNNLLCYETLESSLNKNPEKNSRKKKFRNLSEDEIENLEEAKNFKARCKLCPKRFQSQKGLKIHMNKAHPVSERSYCNICGKYFSNNSSLSHHKKQVHDKSTLVICEVCNKELSNKYSLELHMQKKHS